ncbi:hypothetical protein PoMZ_05663 [Pyricularia oryzae]|uniref:Uncharacterized protein n=1 Tax=Pyricularia oryzae TaxID=318829 RepID=A0A4P7NP81_PYROR|nr:hypothetical protein PoMZ_05663 [Pyricularia oryzae]
MTVADNWSPRLARPFNLFYYRAPTAQHTPPTPGTWSPLSRYLLVLGLGSGLFFHEKQGSGFVETRQRDVRVCHAELLPHMTTYPSHENGSSHVTATASTLPNPSDVQQSPVDPDVTAVNQGRKKNHIILKEGPSMGPLCHDLKMMQARASVIYNPSTLLACRVRGDQEKVPSCRDSMHARVWFGAHRVLAQDYHVRKVRYNSRARPPGRAARGDPGGDHMTDVICGMRHGLCELGGKLDRSQGVFYQQEREWLWVGRNADTNERKYKPTNGVGFCDLFVATFWAWLPWEAGPKWYAIKHNISSGSPERSGG